MDVIVLVLALSLSIPTTLGCCRILCQKSPFAFHNSVISSDTSDKLYQQLEIWNRFNTHESSIFPTLALPIFCHYSIPFLLTHTAQFRSQTGPTYVIFRQVAWLHFSLSNFRYVTWLISTLSLRASIYWYLYLSLSIFTYFFLILSNYLSYTINK